MKTQIASVHTVSGRTIHMLEIPDAAMKELGWSDSSEVSLDIPLTGGGLRITKASDTITLLGGVKEKISNG